MPPSIAVFLGAGIGGVLRHLVNQLAARLAGTDFPWGTLTVNIVGSVTMGLLAGWFAGKGEATQIWRLFLTTGILGGFTTFSTFSLDVVVLWQRGDLIGAAAYTAGSVILAVAGLFAGLLLMRLAG
jgi:fluoride exporter